MSNRVWWREWRAGQVTMGVEIWDGDDVDLDTPTLIELPPETTFDFGSLKFEYDKKRPVGMQKTPILTIKIALEEYQQTDDLRALRTRILDPVSPQPSTLNRGVTPNRDYYTTTTWLIYYRDAAGTRHDIFVGAQKAPGSLSGSIRNLGTPAAGTTVTVTVFHLLQVCLMEVTPEDMMIDMHTWGSALGPKGLAYEEIYLDNAIVCGITNATAAPVYPNTMYLSYHEIWESLHRLTQQVYRAYMRQGTDVALRFTSPLRDGDTNDRATPADHWTAFAQNYLADGARGVAQAVDDWIFPAFVTDSDKTFSLDDCHAGAAIYQGQGVDRDPSLHRFRTMWDMLGVEALWRKSKCQIKLQSWGMELRFQKLYHSSWSAAPDEPHPIAVADLQINSLDWALGADAIGGAKVAIPGLVGDDIAEIPTLRPRGNADQDEMPIRALFHNQCQIRSKEDAYARYKDSFSSKNAVPDVPGNHAFVGLAGDPSPFELYYWTTPSVEGDPLTSSNVPVRLHNEVTVNDGLVATTYFGERVPRPAPSSFPNPDPITNGYWGALRPIILVGQRLAGFGYAVAESMPLSFSSRNQVRFDKLAISLLDLPPHMMGEMLTIGDGDAGAFLDGVANYLNGLRCDRAAVVEWDLALTSGIVTFTVFNLEDY